jgi:hypothetical protein
LSSRLLSRNLEITIYKTIILPAVLCGCEIWSLILREEHRLRVFENRVLRRIFGLKRDEVTGGWRKLHNDKVNDDEIGRNVACIKKKMNVYRILVGKTEGNR